METLSRDFNAEEVRKSFSKVIGIYDFWGKLTESEAARKVIEMAQIRDGSDILEVACGTGVLLSQLVPLDPHGKITGIDLSPAMLKKAHQRLAEIRSGNTQIFTGNALELEFEDETFDLLVNNFMVDLLPESKFNRIASEFYRVLKPGGTAVVSTFSFGYKKIHHFWYWLARHFPGLLTNCRPVNFAPYLQNAGFTIERDMQVSQNTFPSEVLLAKKSNTRV